MEELILKTDAEIPHGVYSATDRGPHGGALVDKARLCIEKTKHLSEGRGIIVSRKGIEELSASKHVMTSFRAAIAKEAERQGLRSRMAQIRHGGDEYFIWTTKQ